MTNVAPYLNFINEDIDPMTGEEKKPTFVKGEKKLLKLFISPKLREILGKMLKVGDFQVKAVANRIMGLSETDELFDISYLDVEKGKDDSITYMPANRVWYKKNFASQEEANRVPSPDDESWTGSGRQSLSIGKLINRLFDNFTDLSVQKFVNAYKAEIAATLIYNRFQVVRGEDIRYWYSEKRLASTDGNLGGSCMKYDNSQRNCQPYFEIYVQNPEKCGLVILTNTDNKLIGRALLWSDLRKPTGKIFMDRIYTIKQSDEELFKKYAVENGWLHKARQEAHNAAYVEDGQVVNKSIALQLKPKQYKQYPYMDTLKFYNPGTGRLASDPGNPVPGMHRYRLENADGQSQRID
jgi:hypothetical protein